MTRTNAREIAVHLIYDVNYTSDTADELLLSRFAEGYYESLQAENDVYAGRPNAKQMRYIREVVLGVEANHAELDAYISKYAVGWRLDRISRLARSIMQLAIYEILHLEDVPTSAAISEAVELTRKYEDEDVVSFVNGILGSFAREVGK